MYHDNIIDHYHNPRNNRVIANATNTSNAHNPSCGDYMTISMIIENNSIKDIAFDGDGCAISQAAASMLTEHVKNKSVKELQKLTSDDMLKLLQIPCSPARIKCALLALETAQKASQ